MKVAPMVVLMFRDTEGFASAISEALHPDPSSSFTRLEDSFDLSLEGYGIKHIKASATVSHFVDNQGTYKVSIVVMQHYEPPVLACALNEVLNNIAGDKSSLMPTLLVPFLVESSKVKGQSKSLRSDESKPLIFGIRIGENTDIMQALLNKTHEPPPSLQIQLETFACFLHFVRVIHVIGEILASTTGLQFSKERVVWNPKKTSGESKEPWRALYG
ncbi:uncharacterized protein LOC113852729 isoform X2 [Abrus precatorius]|uniref:Uncharacterized protein LOC113852729 isoform X2 n=1 Tax=Abrus precatorius TaxID=3816 RepID=A0A8B8K557_ABRPR|nr:uncharacterized protein LOC113852729 isoform X2 [Abrus precatorius]